MQSYFIGIDIGTQGARTVLLGEEGEVVSEKEQDFLLNERSREEQSPDEWWETCLRIAGELIKDARTKINITRIKAIAVTSTSGTVIPLDENNEPLHNALMYSDQRAAEVAAACKEKASDYFGSRPAYTGFNASSGLCKMVWYVKHFPEKVSQIDKWVHAADFITGKLSNNFAISDYTNALKSGYDVRKKQWPSYLYEQLPLKKEWLPKVIPSGAPIGQISPDVAQNIGLSSSIQVTTGMTDGCASQVASGAVKIGDWNTTLGTTLVIKGVTRKPVKDPKGRLYNHRHPMGWWMPGGASNTGADWITRDFNEDLAVLNQQAKKLMPTGSLAYPLCRKGERFPFVAPDAQGFASEGLNKAQLFTANMEGVGYIERYAFEMIESLSGEQVKAVYTAGGGSKSEVWLKIRSNILNLPIYKMKHVTGAVGAAILAASQTHFTSITEAVASLTQIDKEIQSTARLADEYEGTYQQFLERLQEKEYITKKD
jgi:sugar (pentulose or hexulose) kinase